VSDTKRSWPRWAGKPAFVRQVLIVIGVVLASLGLIALIYATIRVWLLVFAAVLFALFLRGVSDPISRLTRLPPAWTVLWVVLLLICLAVLGVWVVIPSLTEQSTQLAETIPKSVAKLQAWMDQHGLGRFWRDPLGIGSELVTDATGALSKAAGFFTVTAGAVVDVMIVLFAGIYFAIQPAAYIHGAIRLFPLSTRPRVQDIINRLGTTLRHWLLGQIVAMSIVGVLIGLGLYLLDVPLALLLGILAGVLDFIPIIGPLISAIPAMLLALMVSPWHALYVAILYIIVNTIIESHLVLPIVQRYAVRLPPAVAIIALVLMGQLFGFLGLLLAVPAVVTAMIIIKMFYIETVLGDAKQPKKDS
jgi:predicted PurR-regulated permease PerM